jgi:hypothetical protein
MSGEDTEDKAKWQPVMLYLRGGRLECESGVLYQGTTGGRVSDTYKILYRHMKIETPAPNSETYDCWVDGNANTVSVQLQGEYGPTGPIETMPLDDDVILSRFGAATCTVIASLSTTIESDKKPRDTQFAGFALALNEKLTLSRLVAQDSPTYDPVIQCRNELQIIAQCAYGLVKHAHGYIETNSDWHMESIVPLDEIPDMTEWPEETSK